MLCFAVIIIIFPFIMLLYYTFWSLFSLFFFLFHDEFLKRIFILHHMKYWVYNISRNPPFTSS